MEIQSVSITEIGNANAYESDSVAAKDTRFTKEEANELPSSIREIIVDVVNKSTESMVGRMQEAIIEATKDARKDIEKPLKEAN